MKIKFFLQLTLHNSKICVDCKSYITDIQQFLTKSRRIGEMYEEIEKVKEIDIENLFSIRADFDLPFPEFVDVVYQEVQPEVVVEKSVEIVEENDEYDINEDSQEEIEICNSDALMMTLDDNLFDDQNLDFDISPMLPPQTTIKTEPIKDEKVKLIEKEKKFKCDQCDKSFKNRFHLRHHIDSHLPVNEKFIHECPKCEKRYSSKFCLRQHIKHIHDKGSIFKCQFCDKIFNRKANLDSHLNHVHTTDKNFECDICGLKVKSKGILRNHKLLHSTNPADMKQCTFCSKQYKTQNQLINHMAKHKKNKEYFTCSICAVTFPRAKQLENHVNSFHNSIS